MYAPPFNNERMLIMKNKTINFPRLDEITEENVNEYILELYQSIGWKKDMDLHPKKIFINKEQWLEICDAFNNTGVSGGGYLWMNYGPTVDDNIPYGKIRIEAGAFASSGENGQ